MFDEMKRKLERTIALLKEDLKSIKTGRAKPAMIEHIEVEAYEGSKMPLIELASITAPDPHLLLVQPWDQSVIKKIEGALRVSELGLNPVVDGQQIRISVPALTEERRREMVKLVGQKVESHREMARNVRNEQKKNIDGMKGEPGVSEDDIHKWLEEMQEIYESYMDQLDEIGKSKEAELMKV